MKPKRFCVFEVTGANLATGVPRLMMITGSPVVCLPDAKRSGRLFPVMLLLVEDRSSTLGSSLIRR
jgi:hypothetical protein